MRQPERSTIPSALFSQMKSIHLPAQDTVSLVPFAEIMRQPREAAKREFSPPREIKVRLKVLWQLIMAKVSMATKNDFLLDVGRCVLCALLHYTLYILYPLKQAHSEMLACEKTAKRTHAHRFPTRHFILIGFIISDGTLQNNRYSLSGKMESARTHLARARPCTACRFCLPFLGFTLQTSLSQQRGRNSAASSCCTFPPRLGRLRFCTLRSHALHMRIVMGLAGPLGGKRKAIFPALVVIDFSLQYIGMSNSSLRVDKEKENRMKLEG